MDSNQTIPAHTVDLTNCDREPIHIPGLIQPHGCLLVLQEPNLTILQVSKNIVDFLGRSPQELLNRPLKKLLSPKQIQSIQNCLAEDFENVNPLKISLRKQHETIVFDGILHRFDGLLILELEPTHPQDKTDFDFFKFHHLVRGTINRLQNTTTLQQMCEIMVSEVQKLTGFDRVMVYRFDETGAGQVLAEARQDELIPYLGLCYPPSDIPKQAKQLYTLNWLRLIPDTAYQPVKLLPALNPLTDRPTNLSLAVLRSVSPIHVEYLHNMGVGASLSISLIKDKKLWGLIACHHRSARYLPYAIRTACEFLGQVMSLELIAKENAEDLDYKMKLKSILARFVESMPHQGHWVENLVRSEADLLALVNASGAAICWNGDWTQVGETPSKKTLSALLDWIETQIQGNLFYTDALPSLNPAMQSCQDIVSGLVALAVSKANRTYILWFRPEVIQTINWGGNPNKPVEVHQDGSIRLSPRKSFALWQETVEGKSLPWKPCEIEAVLELRSAIVAVVLRWADELAKLNLALERSNNELDAFAYIASHDLKEPLRGIHNYSTFLIEDYGEVLNEDGIAKLQTLVRLTQRMEDLINSLLHFSRLGRVELSLQRTDLNELVRNVIDALNLSTPLTKVEIRIPRPLPTIRCDRVQISEVFSNLISNAIKYNDRPQKLVEIGFLDPVDSPRATSAEEATRSESTPVFYVRDNGIGIPEHHLDNIFRIFKRLHGPQKYGGGTGAGLTIAKKIVERHNGRIWVESRAKAGSTFYFTLQP
jgi:light-regulated signal transduction histidine kinase (bacteriophytochrome)